MFNCHLIEPNKFCATTLETFRYKSFRFHFVQSFSDCRVKWNTEKTRTVIDSWYVIRKTCLNPDSDVDGYCTVWECLLKYKHSSCMVTSYTAGIVIGCFFVLNFSVSYRSSGTKMPFLYFFFNFLYSLLCFPFSFSYPETLPNFCFLITIFFFFMSYSLLSISLINFFLIYVELFNLFFFYYTPPSFRFSF